MHYHKDALKPYALCNLSEHLFEVNQWDAVKVVVTGKEEKEARAQLGKTPRFKNWSKKTTSEDQILTHIANGGNVGFRIPKDWIVVDIDPRNYPSGADPQDMQDQVAELLGFFDWEEIEWDYNLVRTGSGGYHIYCQLPDDTIYKRVRTKLKGLAGVDIKRHGGYVIAAGSRHPNGEWYTWEAPLAPGGIVKLTGSTLEGLLREDNGGGDEAHDSYGALNGTELQSAVLRHLDPRDYSDNDSWFPLMCGCHFVTAGAGVEEFVDWSTGDPTYADDAEKIRYRWDSLDDRRGNANTAGTLFHALKNVGADTNELHQLLGRMDFADLADELEEVLGEFTEADHAIRETIKSGQMVADAMQDLDELAWCREAQELAAQPTLLDNEIAALPDDPLAAENQEALDRIGRLLHSVSGAGLIRAENSLKQAGLSQSEINKLKKGTAPPPIDDVPALIRDAMWNTAFKKGEIFLMGGELYRFSSTHWSVLPDTRFKFLAELTAKDFRARGIELPGDLETITTKAFKLAQNRADATDHSKLVAAAATKGIVNCLDCEIHIDGDTGALTKKRHNPASYQMSCLDIEFGDRPLEDYPDMCPKFLARMQQWFSGLDDCDDMIDFVQELFGYVMQPNKNHASIWLLHGSGGNGKSTLLKILENVMGDAVYSAEASIFDSLSGKGDSHETASLPGKLLISVEDMDAGTLIKDGAMKRLSESSDFTANPKFKSRTKFRHTAAVVMCSNGFPKFKSDDGVDRRLYAVPFKGKYVQEGQRQIDVVKEICSDPQERAGILRWALLGLRRLRARGAFKKPASSLAATAEWSNKSNLLRHYMNDALIRIPKAEWERHPKNGKFLPTMKAYELYDNYTQWCMTMGVPDEVVAPKYKFTMEMGQFTDVEIRRAVVDGMEIQCVFGLKIKSEVDSDSDFEEMGESGSVDF